MGGGGAAREQVTFGGLRVVEDYKFNPSEVFAPCQQRHQDCQELGLRVTLNFGFESLVFYGQQLGRQVLRHHGAGGMGTCSFHKQQCTHSTFSLIRVPMAVGEEGCSAAPLPGDLPSRHRVL